MRISKDCRPGRLAGIDDRRRARVPVVSPPLHDAFGHERPPRSTLRTPPLISDGHTHIRIADLVAVVVHAPQPLQPTDVIPSGTARIYPLPDRLPTWDELPFHEDYLGPFTHIVVVETPSAYDEEVASYI